MHSISRPNPAARPRRTPTRQGPAILAFVCVGIALAACKGDDGSAGRDGADGAPGTRPYTDLPGVVLAITDLLGELALAAASAPATSSRSTTPLPRPTALS